MQICGPAIGWLIAIAGWRYVARDNDARQRRKEIRALLNDIGRYIEDIEALAYKYYAISAVESHEQGKFLKRDIRRLASRISTLKSLDNNFNLDSELNEYRQVTTGRDFESSSRAERSHNDAIYIEISESALKLTNAMEKLYADSYK